MNKRLNDSLMNALISLSKIVIVVGAFLKISHYTNQCRLVSDKL